ncbi:MAG: hypothetical protein AB1700_09595 [Bacillota bacterium]
MPDGEVVPHSIADACPEYEPITLAQAFGISFLNNKEALSEARRASETLMNPRFI